MPKDVLELSEEQLAEALGDIPEEDIDPEITECYVVTDKGVRRSDDLMNLFSGLTLRDDSKSRKLVDVAKMIDGSTQEENSFFADKIVEPPYDPDILAKFLEADEIHYRCTVAKAVDFVGRPWHIAPITKHDNQPFDPSSLSDEEKNQIKNEILISRQFLESCNPLIEFEGVTERAAKDVESVGWAAIEVIRDFGKKVARLAHVPATRIRVLRNWEGYVEIGSGGRHTYYQKFGTKVVNRNTKAPYNPRTDGDLSNPLNQWNLIDRETGKPTRDISKAANEIIWIPKHHPKTIYYGLPDVVPALGSLFGNVFIRDYFLQFFENNTVPQYAVIVEGARLGPDVLNTIQTFFTQDIKGKAHKTLIIPVPGSGKEVRIRFEKLSADTKEGSFQETRKANQNSIMTAHGVSPAIIGIADAAELGSGKGLSQAEIYKDRIVTPGQTRWERIINNILRLGLGLTMVGIKFERLDIRDYKLEMEVETGYVKAGVKTINEVRQSADLGDPFEGGDTPFISLQGKDIRLVKDVTVAYSSDAQNQENMETQPSAE